MIYSVQKILLSVIVATLVIEDACAFSVQPKPVSRRVQRTNLAMSDDPVSIVCIVVPVSAPSQKRTVQSMLYLISHTLFTIERCPQPGNCNDVRWWTRPVRDPRHDTGTSAGSRGSKHHLAVYEGSKILPPVRIFGYGDQDIGLVRGYL